MKTFLITACALACIVLPATALAQTRPLRCIVDQFSEAQLKTIGDGVMAGSDGAQAQIEGATATCATKFQPAQLNAAIQYANDTAVYKASSAQLASLGAPGLIDTVWNKVDPAQRKATADALKDGSPPAGLITNLQAALPKSGDTLALSATALMGLQARASMALAEQAGS